MTCSIFDAVCRAKVCFLLFLNGERFNRFVYFGFHLINLVITMHGTFSLSQTKIIAKMIRSIEAYEELDYYEIRMPYVTIVVATTTLIMSFALPIFFYGMWDEPIDIFLDNSYGLSLDLFMWNWKNMTDVNEQLYDKFSENTAINVGLGLINILQDFFANMLTGMLWDLMQTVIGAFYCWRQVFIVNDVTDVLENATDQKSEEAQVLQAAREKVFKKWRMFKPVDKNVNQVFSPLLPLFHMRNVLMYAFLMSICFLPDESTHCILYVYYAYNLVKAEITYIISSRIAEQVIANLKYK